MLKDQPLPRTAADRDEVSKTFFHRLLVFLDQLTSRSIWLVLSLVITVVILNTLGWKLITGQTTLALQSSAVLAFFIGADALLFITLPVLRISFGSWKSQLVSMLFTRTVLSLATAFIVITIADQAAAWSVLPQLSLSLVLIWGSLFEVRRLKLSRVAIRSASYKKDQRPIKILQISDLHIERLTRREQQLLNMVNQIQPDVIVLTGDYLNLSYVSDQQAQNDLKNMLGQLDAPGGVFAVLGGPTVDDRAIVPQLFDDLPIRLMEDEWAQVDIDGQPAVILLGLDCSQDTDIDGINLDHLVHASPNGSPRILLYHTPDLTPQAIILDIDLYLSGHTHGGQIRLPLYGAILTSSKFGKKYEKGQYREGKTNIYVSRGVGLEGLGAPRLRFLSPPEITLFTIMGNSKSAV